jgi:ketosteroid isomerase-like protein
MFLALSAALITVIGVRSHASPSTDIDDVSAVLDEFQDAYSNKRTHDLRELFYSEGVVAFDLDEGERQMVIGLDEWLQSTDEQIFQLNRHISDSLTDREVVVMRNIAYVVCSYTYIDDTHRAQGFDVFTLVKTHDKWRIVSLQWTGDKVETF